VLALASALLAHSTARWHWGGNGLFSQRTERHHCWHWPQLFWRSTALLALGGNGLFSPQHTARHHCWHWPQLFGAQHGTAGTGGQWAFSPKHTARHHCWHWPQLFWRTARHCWHWGNGSFLPAHCRTAPLLALVSALSWRTALLAGGNGIFSLHCTAPLLALASALLAHSTALLALGQWALPQHTARHHWLALVFSLLWRHTARHCWRWGNGSFSTLHRHHCWSVSALLPLHGTLLALGDNGSFSPSTLHGTTAGTGLGSSGLARHRWHPGTVGSFSPAHCTAPLLHWLSSFWRTARTAGTGGTGSFSLAHCTAPLLAACLSSASTALLALGAMAFLPEHRTAPLLALASASGAQHGTAGTVGHGSSPTLHGTTAGTGLSIFWRTARHCWHWGNRLFSSALHGTTAGTGLSSSGAQHGTAGTGAMGLSPQHTARHHLLATWPQFFWRTARHCWHWGGQWPLSQRTASAPLLALALALLAHSTALLALGAMAFLPAHCGTTAGTGLSSGAQHGTAGTGGGNGLFLPAHCTAPPLAPVCSLAHSTALLALKGSSFSSTLHGTICWHWFSFSGAQHGTVGTGGQWPFS
jgi:hypothetical protein